jgi:hypothetical protein
VVQENDAAGGAGSIKSTLIGIAINGLSTAIDGRLARRYPIASFDDNLTDTGQPAGAPQTVQTAAQQAVGLLSNPTAIAIGAAVALSVLIVVFMRR